MSGRDVAESHELIGPLENTLVLRSDFSGDPTFRKMLDQVRGIVGEAYAHRHLPYERLEQMLSAGQATGRSQLFHAMFGFEALPAPTLELPGLVASPMEIATARGPYDLSMCMVRVVEGLRGTLNYDRDLFDETMVTSMLQHFQTVVEGLIIQPDMPISRLPLLTESERHRVLVEWSGAEARLVQTTALPSGIDPLAVTVAHARVVGARTGARRTRALVLLGHAGSRARHALPRGEAAGEGRVVLELALDGARGAEAYLLVGGGLLEARGGGRTEREDEGRRRGR